MVQTKVENSTTQLTNAANVKRKWNFLYNVMEIGNCKGDGTDETAGIQKTIDTAIANGAKTVFFPHGNYVASSLTGLDQVVLFGDNATLSVGGSSVPITQLGAAPLSHLSRQALINGNFDVWQRGTSFSNPAVGAYTADRWAISHSAGAGFGITVSRQAFAPGQTDVPNEPKYFARITVSNAAGATRIGISQPIEDVRTFAGQKVSLSYWIKLSNARAMRPYVINQSFGSGGSAGIIYAPPAPTVLAGVWVKRSFSLTLSSIAGKTIGDNSSLGIEIRVEAPQSGDIIDIAQVQINAGETPLPFQPRSFAEELALCQRYFEKSYSYDVAPATASNSGGIEDKIVPSNTIAVNQTYGKTGYKVKKRTNPTVTIHPYTTPSNTGRVSNSGGADLAANSGNVNQNNDDGFTVVNSSGAALTTTNAAVVYHWTADAEL